MGANLATSLRTGVPDPDARFIETPDGAVIAYRDFFAQSGRLANVLIALGVAPGDRVAVQTGKSPEALALYFACLRAGAAYLPLNPAYTGPELAYFLEDATPRGAGSQEPESPSKHEGLFY